jgi:rod shape determining protein RodA
MTSPAAETALPALNPRPGVVLWPLWIAVPLLLVTGALFVFSATLGDAEVALKQLVWYGVGLAGLLAVVFVDYRVLARWAFPIYWAAIAMLVLVLFFGVERNGARRWFDFGPFSIQPGEFAKLAVIVALAQHLSRPPEELRRRGALLGALGLAGLPFLLILKEPDLGSAIVLVPTVFAMLLVGGVPPRLLGRLAAGGFVLAALLTADALFAPEGWRLIKLKEYQRHRLLVYFGKDFAPENATPEQRRYYRELQRQKSWNVEQALISVGSGGLTGKGWRHGTQNALGYLPRLGAHNDFIFSVLAEETGFVGSVSVIALYGLLVFSGLKAAGQAKDRLGRLLATGVVALLFSHIFINIGMNLGLMPVTGIPLPLLSYGGSAVVCSLVALGLIQNVYLHRRNH